MTGPEHHRESERLLQVAKDSPSGQQRVDCLAAAQVHAILALAESTQAAAHDPSTEPASTNKRHRITRSHLEEVAQAYSSALKTGEPPTRAVANAFVTSHSTAARWVALARETGFLSATTPGRSAS